MIPYRSSPLVALLEWILEREYLIFYGLGFFGGMAFAMLLDGLR